VAVTFSLCNVYCLNRLCFRKLSVLTVMCTAAHKYLPPCDGQSSFRDDSSSEKCWEVNFELPTLYTRGRQWQTTPVNMPRKPLWIKSSHIIYCEQCRLIIARQIIKLTTSLDYKRNRGEQLRCFAFRGRVLAIKVVCDTKLF